MILTLDYCKLVAAEGELRISFIGVASEYLTPLRREDSTVGCRVIEFPIVIPKSLLSGSYEIKFDTLYNLNPLKRDVSNSFKSQPVMINSASD